jgi:hypothetical protein
MGTFAKEFEHYIISEFREESLVSLIPGGQPQQYLNLCKRLNDFQNQISEDVRRLNFIKINSFIEIFYLLFKKRK